MTIIKKKIDRKDNNFLITHLTHFKPFALASIIVIVVLIVLCFILYIRENEEFNPDTDIYECDFCEEVTEEAHYEIIAGIAQLSMSCKIKDVVMTQHFNPKLYKECKSRFKTFCELNPNSEDCVCLELKDVVTEVVIWVPTTKEDLTCIWEGGIGNVNCIYMEDKPIYYNETKKECIKAREKICKIEEKEELIILEGICPKDILKNKYKKG